VTTNRKYDPNYLVDRRPGIVTVQCQKSVNITIKFHTHDDDFIICILILLANYIAVFQAILGSNPLPNPRLK